MWMIFLKKVGQNNNKKPRQFFRITSGVYKTSTAGNLFRYKNTPFMFIDKSILIVVVCMMTVICVLHYALIIVPSLHRDLDECRGSLKGKHV